MHASAAPGGLRNVWGFWRLGRLLFVSASLLDITWPVGGNMLPSDGAVSCNFVVLTQSTIDI